jgi:hypothetical protein
MSSFAADVVEMNDTLVLNHADQRAFSVHNIIKLRLDILKRIAKGQQQQTRNCSATSAVLKITEYPYGQAGNHMISLTHTLWLATKLNATLVVPKWIQVTILQFDLTILNRYHCFSFEENVPATAANVYEITSEEAFFFQKSFDLDQFKHLNLRYDPTLLRQMSLQFVRVCAALWSSPLRNIVLSSDWVIRHYLDNNLRYTAVHKRGLDGGCSKILGTNTKPSDFSTRELPMDMSSWKANLLRDHPLCDMSPEFVMNTHSLHSRNGSKIYVAFDGKGNIDSYKAMGMIFGGVLENNPKLHKAVEMKYVDMFLAMHSDLFIMNPRSTFSWQIFVVRACLALESVPFMRYPFDLYLQKYPEELQKDNRQPWVSWSTIIEAIHSGGGALSYDS